MNILVCISCAPETTAPVKFTPDKSAYDSTGVKQILNPYDEWYALSRAVQLVEENGGEVVVVHVGGSGNNQMLQKALAIGANRSVRINTEAIDAKSVAEEISLYARTQSFDLIVTGKETIDHSGALVGGMIAGFMDWHFESFVSKLDVEGRKAILNRDIEGGYENVAVDLPLVVSASKGMGEQKIPNMRGIMMAKKKPQEVLESQLKGLSSSQVSFELVASKDSVTMVDPDNMNELVRLLKEEAKAI